MSLRCPYCHEALARTLGALECAACAAPHHAPCFVEGRGCAATGCGGEVARVGPAVLSLDALGPVAGDADALLRVASGAAPLTGRAPDDPRLQESYDPIFGTLRTGPWSPGILPDHTEHLRERIAEESLPPQGSARLPDVCPECGGDLTGDEDDPDDGVWFCYHCGRDLSADVIPLAPVDPKGGKP